MSLMAVEKNVGWIGLEAIQIDSRGGRTRTTPEGHSLQTLRHLKKQPWPAAPPNLCASKKRLFRAAKKVSVTVFCSWDGAKQIRTADPLHGMQAIVPRESIAVTGFC